MCVWDKKQNEFGKREKRKKESSTVRNDTRFERKRKSWNEWEGDCPWGCEKSFMFIGWRGEMRDRLIEEVSE